LLSVGRQSPPETGRPFTGFPEIERLVGGLSPGVIVAMTGARRIVEFDLVKDEYPSSRMPPLGQSLRFGSLV